MLATRTARGRLGRATVGVATCALVVTAAACADRPTNSQESLNEHGETGTTTAAPPARDTPPQATRRAAAARQAAAVRQASAAQARAAAVLTAPDVRDEGVSATTDRSPLDPCLAGAVGAADVSPSAAWRYPTGSTLLQYVVPVTNPRAPLPEAAQRCGRPIDVPEQPGIDRQVAWCGQGCGVALVDGRRASVIEVRGADTEARSAEAVRRLAPAAARRLAG